MLEAMLPKQRIFELYLNVIEWGNGVFGAEAAARRYFGVSAAQLTAEQAARARGDDAEPALVRAPAEFRLSRGPRRDDSGAHAVQRSIP